MKNSKLLFCGLVLLFLGTGLTVHAQEPQQPGYWFNIGPSNVSGRVTTLMYDKFNTDVVYAGTAGGGLFVSVNKGTNWQEISLPNNAVTAIAQDDNGVVYVGTGESSYGENAYGLNNGLCQIMGGGVFKMNPIGTGEVSFKNWVAGMTSDAQKYAFVRDNISFSVLATTEPAMYNREDPWAFINDMVCLGNDLYVATNAGLKKLPAGADGNDVEDPNVWQLMAPTTAQTIATDLSKSSNGDLSLSFYTTANGYQAAVKSATNDAFEVILDRKAINAQNPLGKIEMEFAPSDNNVLYAVVAPAAANGGERFAVYHSSDFGATWTACMAPSESMNPFIRSAEMALAIYPTDAERIFIGGNDICEGINANNSNYFYWIRRSDAFAERIAPAMYVHGGIQCIAIDPFSADTVPTILVGTNGGVHKSTNNGVSWTINNKGLNCSQFYSVAVSADGSILGGTQDNSVVLMSRGSELGSNTYGDMIWKPTKTADGYFFNNPFGYLSYNGGGCEASAFQRTMPSPRQPIFVTAPYSGYAKSYGDFLSVNDQTWFLYEKVFNKGDKFSEPSPYAPNITATLLWETNQNTVIRDSVDLKLDTTTFVAGRLNRNLKEGDIIPAGDTVLAVSKNCDVAFKYVFPQAFSFDPLAVDSIKHHMTIRIQDKVQSRYFVGGWSGVWMSDDAINFTKERVNTFQVFVLDTSLRNAQVHCMAISEDGDHLFVGVDVGTQGKLYRVDNLTKGNPAVPATMSYATNHPSNVLRTVEVGSYNRNITSISVDKNNPNNVLLTFGLYDASNPNLMISTNALADAPDFAAVNSRGIENVMPIYSSLIQGFSIEGTNEKHAFIGTEQGVFKTEDITASTVVWTKEEGMPNVPVFQIKQQQKAIEGQTFTVVTDGNPERFGFLGTKSPGAVYFATYGKGVWVNTKYMGEDMQSIDNVRENREEVANVVLTMYPNPAKQKTTVEFTLGAESPVVLRSFDINGRMIHNMDLGKLGKGSHQEVLEFNNTGEGVYIIQVITGCDNQVGKLILQ